MSGPHSSPGPTPFLSLAAAQTVPRPGDVARNVAEHVRLAHAAADAGAEVVVFPELSLTGYELGLAAGLAFAVGDRRLEPLLAAARERALTLIAGAPIRIDERLCIGAFVIGGDAAIEVYTKHHLGAFPASAAVDGTVPPAEATVFAPGLRAPLVRCGRHLGAVAICADANRPPHAAAAAQRGADTYLACTFVIPSEFADATAQLRRRALDHGMAVVFANFGGPSGGLSSAGQSTIWNERGDELARLGVAGSGLVVATQDADGWRARAIPLVG